MNVILNKCRRCGYETRHKHVFLKHLQRKTPCQALIEDVCIDTLLSEMNVQLPPNTLAFKCTHCSKQFNDRSNRLKHEKICKSRPTESFENSDLLVLQMLTSEIMSLKNEIKDLKSNDRNQTNITTDNRVTNVQNIIQVNQQLNPFERERLDHITPADLTDCMLRMESGFTTLVKKIHFNEDVPENMNVRYKSMKQNIIEVFEDGKWTQHDADWVLDIIVNKGYRILSSHFIGNLGMEELKDRQETIQAFLSNIGARKGNTFFGLKREIFILIKGNPAGDRICLLTNNE